VIRNETQYQETVARLDALQRQLICEREQFRRAGIPDSRIDQFIGELMSGCEKLEEEIATYRMRTSRTWVPA
jgi:hypothetical protein